MSSRLTLTLPPALGNQTIEVDTKRFSIGRTPENDLVIEDTSLSRRHALIENFEGRFNLSDCGSSNGTFVNGTPITALTELSDWDVLTFGGVGDILVRIDDDSGALGTHASGVQHLGTGASGVLHAGGARTIAKPIAEVNAQVQHYKRSSTLRDELQAMKRALPQVSATAKSNGVRPALAVYATLARMDKDGGRGDPGQVAATIYQSLSRTRAMFGDEQIANDTLLWVASLEEGPSLQSKITKFSGRVSDSPSTIRTIWYLHDHQVISDQTHNFVLRFLALGVIAQNPQKFGIAAEPLSF